jgi:CheY-like chemotaxis protein
MKAISEGTNWCPAANLAGAVCRKDDFVAILAHELRHPLAPIRSGLDFLRSGSHEPQAVTKTLDMMARQVSQLTQLVDDLFDVVGLRSGKVSILKKRVELHSILWGAIETSLPVIDAAGHHLLLDIPDASVLIEADPGRISQVVVNLLNNAAKYTPDGGQIELSVRHDERQVQISVTDNGAGLCEESLSSIFEMFSQADPRINLGRPQSGLGIGLSLVRQLVELHGGTVHVTSAGLGLGSTFAIRLPLAQAILGNSGPSPAVAAPHPAQWRQAKSKKLRILVVDDHVDAAQMLAAVLELEGHTVATACNGHQAVQMACEFRPELAFIDIEMPGMNGYETAQAMRQVAGLAQMTLVALTGWSGKESQRHASNAGFDHHLSKPTELATVRTLLAEMSVCWQAPAQ